MTQEREALKLALEALEQWNTPLYKRGTAITAIKEALAQPVAMVLPPIVEPTTKSEPIYIMGRPAKSTNKQI